MIIIGITGSIGMGKTTIASMLRLFKIPVFDSDQQVKKILEKDTSVIKKIGKEWPETVLNKERVNKLLLANRIFNNKTSREKLEKIIHPIVNEKRKIFLQENRSSFIVGLDVPLLYETGMDTLCHHIFLANTSEKIQKRRVLLRQQMTEKMFNLIKDSQWSYDRKKEKRPFIINTSYGKFVSFIIVVLYLIKIIVDIKSRNE